MRSTLAFLLLLSVTDLYAQNIDTEVSNYVAMVKNGQVEQAKQAVPGLLSKYPNNPGVLFLQGLTSGDGAEAVRIYQSIVDNFPKSEWADDALYKLYQYYYSVGLYKTADQKLEQLKREFPFSTYATDQKVVEEPKVTPPPETPAKVSQPSKGKKSTIVYTVQAGTFRELQNAEELKSRFERDGYASHIFTIVNSGKKFHKVWVGEFATQDEAKRFSGEIKKKYHLETIVVPR